MLLAKKDPSLRVAATDPHLVSLGGGRLSTAVTIHYIHIGDTTIGCASDCSIPLNGPGVRSIHCTIYRSEDNKVTIVPEKDARLLIDGTNILEETNLTQGAMITIGDSNYLRFNNPDEALMIRSAMDSNEHQMDFNAHSTQQPTGRNIGVAAGASGGNLGTQPTQELERLFNNICNPTVSRQQQLDETMSKSMINMPSSTLSTPSNLVKSSIKHSSPPLNLNGMQCPKVFTADLVTVNMPARDVLGQKYASFAKNLAENHRNEKHMNYTMKCNSLAKSLTQQNNSNNSNNLNHHNHHIPGPTNNCCVSNSNTHVPSPQSSIAMTKFSTPSNSSYSQNVGTFNADQLLTKVQNSTAMSSHHSQIQNHDRYPKSYGRLQIFSMNDTDINATNDSTNEKQRNCSTDLVHLDDMLEICTEYANQSSNENKIINSGGGCSGSGSGCITSSPIVQNRIKTNGSLPRENKLQFYRDLSSNILGSSNENNGGNADIKVPLNSSHVSTSYGYENIRVLGPNKVEFLDHKKTSVDNTKATTNSNANTRNNNSENIAGGGGKYFPQSPRTKIRTTCMSPKRDISFNSSFAASLVSSPAPVSTQPTSIPQTTSSSKPIPPYKPPTAQLPTNQHEYEQIIKSFQQRRQYELVGNSSNSSSAATSTSLFLLPQENNSSLDVCKKSTSLATTSSSNCTNNENNTTTVTETNDARQNKLKQNCLEAAHNPRTKHSTTEFDHLQSRTSDDQLGKLNETAAIDEQQSKLQALQRQIHRFEAQRNATRVMEENQQAKLKQTIEMKQDQVKKLKAMLKQKPDNKCLGEELERVSESLESDRKTFEDLEFQYFEEESEFHAGFEDLKALEKQLTLEHINNNGETLKGATNNENNNSSSSRNKIDNCEDDLGTTASAAIYKDNNDEVEPSYPKKLSKGLMSQSLFGSAEFLEPPRRKHNEDIMSKSINENLFFNQKIEMPVEGATRRGQLQIFDIDVSDRNNEGLTEKSPTKDNSYLEFKSFLKPLKHMNPPKKDSVPSLQDNNDNNSSSSSCKNSNSSSKSMSVKEKEWNYKSQYDNHHVKQTQENSSSVNNEKETSMNASNLSDTSNLPQNSTTIEDQASNMSFNLDKSEQQQQQSERNIRNKHQQEHHFSQSLTDHLSLSFLSSSSTSASSVPPSVSLLQRCVRPLSDANSEHNCKVLKVEATSPKSSSSTQSVNDQWGQQQHQQKMRTSSNASENCSRRSSRSDDSNSEGKQQHILPKHQRPLTRYLPIFSSNLNLRHHIESAGHQVDLCPHVFIDERSCRGYLHKLGATFHVWSRRWFVLDRQRRALIYYSDKLERKPRGGAYFSTIHEVYLDHLNASKSGRPHSTFIVKTKKRNYNLQAASDAAARIWIDAIITGAQGNSDYLTQ